MQDKVCTNMKLLILSLPLSLVFAFLKESSFEQATPELARRPKRQEREKKDLSKIFPLGTEIVGEKMSQMQDTTSMAIDTVEKYDFYDTLIQLRGTTSMVAADPFKD